MPSSKLCNAPVVLPNKFKVYFILNLKKELVSSIEEFIKNHPDEAHKTISQIASEAIQLRIQELKN